MPNEKHLTRDELDEWRLHPVTEWLLAVLRKGAEANRAGLQSQLWDKGSCDPEALGRVKAQCDLIEDLMETTHDEWNGWYDDFTD